MLPRFSVHLISLHGVVTLAALGIFVIVSHALRQRRHPSAAIAWFVSLALMPYVALPLYLLLGNRKVLRRSDSVRRPQIDNWNQFDGLPAGQMQTLVRTLGLPVPTSYDHLELHKDGREALTSLLSVIDSAYVTLDVCTFILARDVLGHEIIDRLALRAKHGVKVRVMIDGVGRYLDGHPDLSPLKKAGVEVAMFISPWIFPFSGKANLRNHRKMAIADGVRVWMGGRNLAAEYFQGDASVRPKQHAWIDLTFCLQGPVAEQAKQQFERDWNFTTRRQQVHSQASTPASPMANSAGERSVVQLVPSGPDQQEDTIYALLVSGCFAARTRILAVSPYFVPDATLQMAFSLAARRGVKVDLLLPSKSNHRLADIARSASLRELSASGVRIWLLPKMIHAKAVVIDNEFALAGSANLDERSLFLNYEIMAAFYNSVDIEHFARWIELNRRGATLHEQRRPGIARAFSEGLVRWVAFQL